MAVNKAACIGILIGVTAAAMMAVKLHKPAQPPSRDAVIAFEQQVSTLAENPLPDTSLEGAVITDDRGRKIALTDFKGKPVILNFWATWCAPCVKELPSLAKLKQDRSDLTVLVVSRDLQKEAPALKTFLKENNSQALDTYLDQGPALKKLLPARGLPSTYILSGKGKILYKIEGDVDWSSHITLDFLDYVVKSQD